MGWEIVEIEEGWVIMEKVMGVGDRGGSDGGG